ncbi:MAG TPA: hypothetical protein DEA05_03595 [Rhodobacteraceae bacterium]|nr:hypothetical protein [Paracoccaceae bacterium]
MAAVTGLAGAVALLLTAFPVQLRPYFSESGPVETASAFALALAALVCLGLRPLSHWAHLAMLSLLLAEREFEPESLAPDAILRQGAEVVDLMLHTTPVQVVLGLWLLGGLAVFT